MSEKVPQNSRFLVYQAKDGKLKIDVRLEDETVWLTQQLIAELFRTTVPNISMHIRNVFEEGELAPEATVKKFLTVREEGSRQVQRNLLFMRSFAEAHPYPQIVKRLVSQILWGHIIRLLQKVKGPDDRRWYVQKAIEKMLDIKCKVRNWRGEKRAVGGGANFTRHYLRFFLASKRNFEDLGI